MEKRESFKSFTDELSYNIEQAEKHARKAHDMLYSRSGKTRSLWYKMALGRAQSILMSLHVQEVSRKEKSDGGGRDDAEVSNQDRPSGRTTSW